MPYLPVKSLKILGRDAVYDRCLKSSETTHCI